MAEGSEFAAVVKKSHNKLRNVFRSGKPVDDLWQEHVSDKDGLQVYAKAMQGLATGSWAGREGECRILWCVQTCKEYWSHRLELLLLKDLRRLTHNAPTLIQPTSMLPLSPPAVRELVDRLSSRPWQLLDVGSCYNPFLEWPQFMVTAIDIAPATESVLECDFLSVDITSGLNSSDYNRTEMSGRGCNQLFGDSYDVVVFSLLLSYLPSTEQRLKCCVNAHRVLNLHGLLLVITPDSSHQNRHASFMVEWKHCIEAAGFHRWKYDKLSHLHCMAFRKVKPTRQDYSDVMLHHLSLAIPQDKTD